MAALAKRAIVIGIDGASMEIVRHMAAQGATPHLKRLMDTGAWRPMLGVFPTLTPPGWTSIATGAWPGTHEVMDFNIRVRGKPLTETVWGVNTELCTAEYFWNTLERAGKTPVLVKWEMSWPPTVTTGVQVEGTGPGVANHHQIAGYHLWVAGAWRPRPIGGGVDAAAVDPSTLQAGEDVDRVELRPADLAQWAHAPDSVKPPLEFELVVQPLARGRSDLTAWGTEGAEPRTFYGLVYAQSDAGYDRVRVCAGRDGSQALADLAVGDWGEWSRQQFTIGGRALTGYVRFKLITLTPDADTFEIFMPQVWATEEYTYPAEVAAEIDTHVGPFLQNPGRDTLGLVDDETVFELMDAHHDCLADVAHHLCATRDWDVLFTEVHSLDYGNHFFMGQTDPRCGAPESVVARSHEGMTRIIASVDRWVGRLLELQDDETVVVVTSDHGGTPDLAPPLEAADVLEKVGLLVVDPATGEIDLSQSAAIPVGTIHVFVNLKGRDPGGIVEPDDFEKVQQRIIHALTTYVDPDTGRQPFALAVTRENAEMLNLWGDLVGDVVWAVHPEYDACHGRHLPAVSLGIGGQHTTFIISGAGVRNGVALQGQARSVDIAPTLAYLLGVPQPRDAEGRVLMEALET